ncbi:MAG: LysM peptidoglycan-binding domain-containing protein [Oscillospiraceae bacterium]|nr:LysM peptidoglycan-binding domain-containing protein [Oscillospiraceae bacterium]MDY5581433.1 LysM peptidoglycan-binding domain-containing protein [Oscillospiraceae bacterium]
MNIKRRLTGAAAVLLACIAALVFAALVPARAIPPSGGRQYRGIDISEFQGEIDFEEVRRSGIEAVYIRVGAGEYTDEYFAENYERAKAAGLKIGFYHYVTARSVDEGRRQARFFASLAAGREPDMRLAMDFEYFGSLSVSQINAISEAYLDELTALTKREAVIYSDLSNARNIFSRALAEKYPLWAAQYGADEPSANGKWREWVGFQYTDEGRVGGIYGNVDRNIFTEGIFLSDSWRIDGEKRTTVRAGTRTLTVYVRAGDTLWAIAREYGTTVEAIARENRIADPNRIFAGERLRITLPARGSGEEIYTVRRGDTTISIAGKFGVTLSALEDRNGLERGETIYAGDKLSIPGAGMSGEFYVVRPGDTLFYISRRTGVPIRTLVGINRIKDPDLIYAGEHLKLSAQKSPF